MIDPIEKILYQSPLTYMVGGLFYVHFLIALDNATADNANANKLIINVIGSTFIPP
ncbi:hypothetical protein D3C81_1815830 [compost metagenome]